MHRVEAFRLPLRQMDTLHGTNLESRILDVLNDLAGKVPLDSVRLDDGQRPLGHIGRL